MRTIRFLFAAVLLSFIAGAPAFAQEGGKKALTPDVKAVILQRSKGYDWRETLSSENLLPFTHILEASKNFIFLLFLFLLKITNEQEIAV